MKSNLLILGAISCVLVSIVAFRLQVFSERSQRLKINLRVPLYLPWLFKEILKSNLHVARIILDPKLPIEPQSLWMHASQKTDTGLAVHANSITLTPATISIDTRGKDILVHALTNHAAQGIIDGKIDKQVTKLEGFLH